MQCIFNWCKWWPCDSLSPLFCLYKTGEVILRMIQINSQCCGGISICLDGLCKSGSKIMSVIDEPVIHPQSFYCSRQHKICTQTSRQHLSPRLRSHQSLYPLAFVLQNFFFSWASRASAHLPSIVPPANDQVRCDAASLSFTASMRYRHTQAGTQTSFSGGTVWWEVKKTEKSAVKMPTAQNTARVLLMGRCLKHWQLSRDNDCLVGFHLHFSTEASAFVVRGTLQMYKHIQKQCCKNHRLGFS